jgi:CMP-N-acetylneuraminic acid synthetase
MTEQMPMPMLMPKILAIIPARAGSKRVAHKNIKPLGGKPLIAWTIDAALKTELNMDVVVSTDSQEIADIALQYGAKVPFLRPDYLATDTSSSFDAIEYTIERLREEGHHYDYLMLLQPTSPLRQSRHIEEVFALLQSKAAKAILSVSEIDHPIEWSMTLEADLCVDHYIHQNAQNLTKRSQDFEKRYRINGALFCIEIGAYLNYKTFYLPTGGVYSYVMENKYGIDIDELSDFEYAEFLHKRKKL